MNRPWNTKRVIFVGVGAVTKTCLPLLNHHFGFNKDQVFLFDPVHPADMAIERFGRYFQTAITQDNYEAVLCEWLRPGDLLVNLANEVSSYDLCELAKKTGALYLDTVTEPWPGFYDNPSLSARERSNSWQRKHILGSRQAHEGPTAVLTHGVNPGLISHFVKQALQNIANNKQLKLKAPRDSREYWVEIARKIDLRAIHVSEYDAQQTHTARTNKQFFNTWSAHGFISEAGQPSELGWGTHEKVLPVDGASLPCADYSTLLLERLGAQIKARTWIPDIGPFQGWVVTHAEAITLCEYLSDYDEQGRLTYRPTVHYVYRPCDMAIASMHDLEGSGWDLHERQIKVLNEEIVEGKDHLGVTLGFGESECYWYGSVLSIHEARRMVPDYKSLNATTVQVAAGVISGMVWAFENPDRGLVEPEQMDFRRVMEIALPYLGEVKGVHSDWHPLKTRHVLKTSVAKQADPWQFSNVTAD